MKISIGKPELQQTARQDAAPLVNIRTPVMNGLMTLSFQKWPAKAAIKRLEKDRFCRP